MALMDREVERKAKAGELLRAALAVLEQDLSGHGTLVRQATYSSALWKIVDAAGLVSPVCEEGALGQPGWPTGRGFSLAAGQRWLKHMHPEGSL